jgi:CheY-like chemotaxis protein
MEAWGAVVEQVADPFAALRTVDRSHLDCPRPDALVIDLDTPEPDAGHLALRVAAEPPVAAVPIVLLSSRGHLGRDAAGRDPAITHVSKPVRPTRLLSALVALIGLPAPEGSAQPTSADEGSAAARSSAARRLRVLVAEDNEVNQTIIAKMLEKAGHEPRVVANGREVMAALEGSEWDLVLMDCQMPEMDGYEASRAIRDAEVHTGRHLPIVALTANAMQGDRERCLAAGMDAYLAKPITRKMLHDALDRWAARA